VTHVEYIIAGYSITFGAIAAYAAWVVARSRSVARTLETDGLGQGPPAVERAGQDH
jgi:hypothetical protein